MEALKRKLDALTTNDDTTTDKRTKTGNYTESNGSTGKYGSAGDLETALDKMSVNSHTKRNQAKSPLLQLPAEVRVRIYEYALGGLHIYETRVHIGSTHMKNRIVAFEKTELFPDASRLIPVKDLLQFSKVCRQLYCETSLLPFQLNVYHGIYRHPEMFSSSLSSPWIVSERWQREAITAISLQYGEARDVIIWGAVPRFNLDDLPKLNTIFITHSFTYNAPSLYDINRFVESFVEHIQRSDLTVRMEIIEYGWTCVWKSGKIHQINIRTPPNMVLTFQEDDSGTWREITTGEVYKAPESKRQRLRNKKV
ncbi:hypothetical protein P280DRAFT_511737 [Massarina eburnea CBS 473.64]|uniref:Uncharacterized protein n=1 Tax=Massarina eburnea CBS 473.64 TaxID=1395130 RepID=A0A6A6RHR6_9PLEO|nr:hypothetical protein P280DRAFT_511737 [Massarina eburnea CBS 473.64]